MKACPHEARIVKEEGFMVYIGGKGGREIIEGVSMKIKTVQEIIELINGVLSVYNRYADKPQRERLASTMKRIGQTKFINETKKVVEGKS